MGEKRKKESSVKKRGDGRGTVINDRLILLNTRVQSMTNALIFFRQKLSFPQTLNPSFVLSPFLTVLLFIPYTSQFSISIMCFYEELSTLQTNQAPKEVFDAQ